jgi:hypothetical protein
MPYTVSLYPASLVLQIPNPTLSLSTSSKFQIPLLDVYDVHSIASKDLPPGFVSPPPGFSFIGEEELDGGLYVFEVRSYGGRVERFATGSLKERSSWVGQLM